MDNNFLKPVVEGVWKMMRVYQRNLVLQWCNRMEKPAVEDEPPRNCVVLLPTGLGKTIIGVAVIEWFLSLANRVDKIVVMLTPTTILANQQSDYLRQKLGCKVKVLHGQSNNTEKYDFLTSWQSLGENLDAAYDRCVEYLQRKGVCPELLRSTSSAIQLSHTELEDLQVSSCCNGGPCRIFVMTPMAFIQKLQKGFINYSKRVGLLVVDECHHCADGHPYAEVLQNFHARMPVDQRPYVLGLSASPLKNKMKFQGDYEDFALKLIRSVRNLEAKLDAEIVSVPSELMEFYEKKTITLVCPIPDLSKLSLNPPCTDRRSEMYSESETLTVLNDFVWDLFFYLIDAEESVNVGDAVARFRDFLASNGDRTSQGEKERIVKNLRERISEMQQRAREAKRGKNFVVKCWEVVKKHLTELSEATGIWGMVSAVNLFFGNDLMHKRRKTRPTIKNETYMHSGMTKDLALFYDSEWSAVSFAGTEAEELNCAQLQANGELWASQKALFEILWNLWKCCFKLDPSNWPLAEFRDNDCFPILPPRNAMQSAYIGRLKGVAALSAFSLGDFQKRSSNVKLERTELGRRVDASTEWGNRGARFWSSVISLKCLMVETMIADPECTLSLESRSHIREEYAKVFMEKEVEIKVIPTMEEENNVFTEASHHIICPWCLQRIKVKNVLDSKKSALEALRNHNTRDNCRLRPKSIIFCRSRLGTVIVQAYMALRLNSDVQNGQKDLARVPTEMVISTKNAAGVLGKLSKQNKSRQNDILRCFRLEDPLSDGFLQTLVSTSVLSEGIDLPACNIVIRFDGVATPVENIQCRGRARQAVALYVHFVPQVDADKEGMNLLICKLYDEFLIEFSDSILHKDGNSERLSRGSFYEARDKMRSLWLEVQPKSKQRQLNEYFPCLVNEETGAFVSSNQAKTRVWEIYHSYILKKQYYTAPIEFQHFFVAMAPNQSFSGDVINVNFDTNWYDNDLRDPIVAICQAELPPFAREISRMDKWVKFTVVVRSKQKNEPKKWIITVAAVEALKRFKEEGILDQNFTLPEEIKVPPKPPCERGNRESDHFEDIRRKIPHIFTLSGFANRCMADTSSASAVSTEDLRSLLMKRSNEVCKPHHPTAVLRPLDSWDIPSVKMYLHFISFKPSSAASDLFAFGGLGGFWLGNERGRKRMSVHKEWKLWSSLSEKVKSCGANVLMPVALLLRTPLCSCREGMSCLCSGESNVGCQEGKDNAQFTFPSYLSIDKKKDMYHPPGELTIQPVDNPTFFTSQQDSYPVVSEPSIGPDELCECQKDAMSFAVCLSPRQCLILSMFFRHVSHLLNSKTFSKFSHKNFFSLSHDLSIEKVEGTGEEKKETKNEELAFLPVCLRPVESALAYLSQNGHLTDECPIKKLQSPLELIDFEFAEAAVLFPSTREMPSLRDLCLKDLILAISLLHPEEASVLYQQLSGGRSGNRSCPNMVRGISALPEIFNRPNFSPNLITLKECSSTATNFSGVVHNERGILTPAEMRSYFLRFMSLRGFEPIVLREKECGYKFHHTRKVYFPPPAEQDVVSNGQIDCSLLMHYKNLSSTVANDIGESEELEMSSKKFSTLTNEPFAVLNLKRVEFVRQNVFRPLEPQTVKCEKASFGLLQDYFPLCCASLPMLEAWTCLPAILHMTEVQAGIRSFALMFQKGCAGKLKVHGFDIVANLRLHPILLQKALTAPSASQYLYMQRDKEIDDQAELLAKGKKKRRMCSSDGGVHYQTLEFLGDAILKYFSCLLVYLDDVMLKSCPPAVDPEALTKSASDILSNSTLAKAGKKHKFADFLHARRFATKKSLFDLRLQSIADNMIADVFEALLAVVFLSNLCQYSSAISHTHSHWGSVASNDAGGQKASKCPYGADDETTKSSTITVIPLVPSRSMQLEDNFTFLQPPLVSASPAILSTCAALDFLMEGVLDQKSFLGTFSKLRTLESELFPNANLSDIFWRKKAINNSVVEEIWGYKFRNQNLLSTCRIHRSYILAMPMESVKMGLKNSYEELEFLGDAILQILSSLFIFVNFPMLSEGGMTILRKGLVMNNFLGRRIMRRVLNHFKGSEMYNGAEGNKGIFNKVLLHSSSDETNAAPTSLNETIKKFEKEMREDLEEIKTEGCSFDGDYAIDTAYDESPDGLVQTAKHMGNVPKQVSDVYEALVGATFIDCQFDLETVWNVIRSDVESSHAAILKHVAKMSIS